MNLEVKVAPIPEGVWRDSRAIPADVSVVAAYQIPLRMRFRGITVREGLLLRGGAGWGEAAPFWDYGPRESANWLRAGLEAACWSSPVVKRDRVPVNVTIPVCDPQRAYQLVLDSRGCATAKVKVADPGVSLDEDAARVRAVRAGLDDTVGKAGRIRVDANAAWTLPQARRALEVLDLAAGGLEYAEQPCGSVADLVRLRKDQLVPIAADESIRRAADPMQVLRAGGADVAVIKIQPLGGVRAALKWAEQARSLGVDVVISSALDSGVGLAHSVRAAALLPQLPHACGLATGQLLTRDVVSDPVSVVDGSVALSRPQVDLDAWPSDSDLGARWSERLRQILAVLEGEEA